MTTPTRALTTEQAGTVQALRCALTAAWGRCDVAAARERLSALAAAQEALEAAGEVLGTRMLAVLAAEARATLQDLETREAERVAERQRSLDQTVAELAAELDGAALVLDGGPSTTGAAEWIESVEQWAEGFAT